MKLMRKVRKKLFLSDNPLEVKAAIASGMSSYIVEKPGNYPLSDEERSKYRVVTDLHTLFSYDDE